MRVTKKEDISYEKPVKLYKKGKNHGVHYSLAEGDYAGFQLRIAALMSNDPTMIYAFKELGGDLHSVTAVQLYYPLGGMSLDDFLKEKGKQPYKGQRRVGKTVNFGFCATGDTLLRTTEGDIRLDSFITEKGYKPYTGDIKVINDKGTETITYTYKTQAFSLLVFELSNGATLKLTYGHTCYVIREGQEIKTTAKGIKKTDLFFDAEGNTFSINSFTVESHMYDPIDVYCVTVEPSHRVIFNGIVTGQCFGKIAPSFAKQDLEPNWTPQEAKEFCIQNNLQPKNGDYFLASAEYIRNKFFSTYANLMPWMDELHKTGRREGAIYSAFGARRLVPELTYVGEDDDRKVISNLENICVNSPVQNHECVIINRSERRAQEILEHGCEENGYEPMETHINGMTHDAVNWTVADEERWFYKKIHEIFETDYPENLGVPISYEIDEAHPDDPINPSVWGFGDEV